MSGAVLVVGATGDLGGRIVRGVDAVITSAMRHSHRKKGDSLETDFEGNRNLVAAAKGTHVPRFVLTSILQCNLARDVPHFWAKKETEDYLEEQGARRRRAAAIA